MAETSAKDELRSAGAHAKEALRATLLAARGALDLAIRKLDEDADPAETAEATTASNGATQPSPEGAIDMPNQ